MLRLTNSFAVLALALCASHAGAAVFQIAISGSGYVSVNGGPERAGDILLSGFGESSRAVDVQPVPSLFSSFDIVAPLDRLIFRGPGIQAEGNPGAFYYSQAGGPSTQSAQLDGTALHWPFSIPPRWPLNLVSFTGGAYAYQPIGPFITSTGDVVAYRYATDGLALSGGPSALPPPAPAVAEPGTMALVLSGVAAWGLTRRRAMRTQHRSAT